MVSSSNDVLPSPVEVSTSSTNTPGNCWKPQSPPRAARRYQAFHTPATDDA